MTNMVAWVIATVVTLPLIGWYLLYITSVKVTKNKHKSVRLASDWTSVLFMAGVYFIIYELWDRSFFWVILAVFFLVALIFTWVHWKEAGDIHVHKLIRGIWRLNFMLFLIFYLILSSYGLLSRVIS